MLTTIADNVNGEIIEIFDKTEINHIKNVYRLKVGDKIRVIDYNFEYISEILSISKNLVELKILEKNEDNYSLDINLDLAIGILKNEKMKLLIQKLTEVGVNKIIPFNSERVVVKIDDKKDKWDTIIKESMKQCRAVKKTDISEIIELKNIKFNEYDKIIYAYESSDSSFKIKDIVNNLDKKILCIVGPEGGFSLEEVNFLKNYGAIEVSLGKRILRAETAAIVLSGMIINLI